MPSQERHDVSSPNNSIKSRRDPGASARRSSDSGVFEMRPSPFSAKIPEDANTRSTRDSDSAWAPVADASSSILFAPPANAPATSSAAAAESAREEKYWVMMPR